MLFILIKREKEKRKAIKISLFIHISKKKNVMCSKCNEDKFRKKTLLQFGWVVTTYKSDVKGNNSAHHYFILFFHLLAGIKTGIPLQC